MGDSAFVLSARKDCVLKDLNILVDPDLETVSVHVHRLVYDKVICVCHSSDRIRLRKSQCISIMVLT